MLKYCVLALLLVLPAPAFAKGGGHAAHHAAHHASGNTKIRTHGGHTITLSQLHAILSAQSFIAAHQGPPRPMASAKAAGHEPSFTSSSGSSHPARSNLHMPSLAPPTRR